MRLAYLIATFFYIGKSKIAPGTLASLLTVLVWYLFVPDSYSIRLILLLSIFYIGKWSINFIIPKYDEKDPQFIVIDEVLGMSIPLMFIFNDLHIAFLSFLLFRLFDIVKPSIVYYAQYMKEPYGILMDDILAGTISALIVINYL